MVTIVVASLYRESKNTLESWLPSDAIYQDFLWGFSEHREMLVAIGLLIYAISRWRALKNLQGVKKLPSSASHTSFLNGLIAIFWTFPSQFFLGKPY